MYLYCINQNFMGSANEKDIHTCSFYTNQDKTRSSTSAKISVSRKTTQSIIHADVRPRGV